MASFRMGNGEKGWVSKRVAIEEDLGPPVDVLQWIH